MDISVPVYPNRLETNPIPKLQSLMDKVTVTAWRLFLQTPHIHATTPMIRGVWGRALRRVDRSLYDRIFAGANQQGHNLPRYILRPAPPDPNTAPAIDWILFDVDQRHERTLWKAWDMACAMGLGTNRNPFRIRKHKFLAPDNSLTGWDSWTLGHVRWPLPEDPILTPCLLKFDVPLRLIKQSRLIQSPAFEDLITASLRRIAGLAGMPRSTVYGDLMRAAKFVANHTVTEPWVGEKYNLVRWSAAQQREVKLFGVTGTISLPNGPGPIWPLLATAQWCHLGKGTVFGMGQIHILPYQNRSV